MIIPFSDRVRNAADTRSDHGRTQYGSITVEHSTDHDLLSHEPISGRRPPPRVVKVAGSKPATCFDPYIIFSHLGGLDFAQVPPRFDPAFSGSRLVRVSFSSWESQITDHTLTVGGGLPGLRGFLVVFIVRCSLTIH